eukprot:5977616-Ditylum_brightwellii.AAC.1
MPQRFECFYPAHALLLLLRTIYGLKQAAMQFWRELQKAFKYMKFKRNKVDPCLRFSWIDGFLVVWITWVDDYLNAGPPMLVEKSKTPMKSVFDCDELGEMEEYVGCKVDYNKDLGKMKLTQPVLLQSYEDESNLDKNGRVPRTPAKAGSVLSQDDK